MHTVSEKRRQPLLAGLRRTALLLACLGANLAGASTVTVFACEPEWAALVKVLMPQAKLHVATHARQDPHHIEARPALIAQLRSADLVVCTGAGLEAGWLPMLQQRAANRKAQEGQPTLFYAAEHVRLIDPRSATLNPFAGDVHPEGNPHVHADPRRIATLAKALAERMGRIWPEQASEVMARHQAWSERWQSHLARWAQQGRALQGRKVVSQHTTFAYLWDWLGMEVVADLEPKPGLPPTPGHLNRLLENMHQRLPSAIVLAAHQDDRSARWLAQQLQGKVPVLVLPASVDEPGQDDALAHWFDGMLSQLLTTTSAR